MPVAFAITHHGHMCARGGDFEIVSLSRSTNTVNVQPDSYVGIAPPAIAKDFFVVGQKWRFLGLDPVYRTISWAILIDGPLPPSLANVRMKWVEEEAA